MSTRQKIRVGIIGTGAVSGYHARAFSNSNKAQIVATCDLFEKRASEAAEEWGAKKVYTDYRELLKDKEVNTVGIYTRPASQHAEIAIEAAKGGKHISCQKPMALSAKDADEVVRAVRKAGIKYQYSEPNVWLPAIMEAKHLIEIGEIGEPRYIHLVQLPLLYYGQNLVSICPSSTIPVGETSERQRRETLLHEPLTRELEKWVKPERFEDLREAVDDSKRFYEIFGEIASVRERSLEEKMRRSFALRQRGDLEKYDLEDIYIDHSVHWIAAVYVLMGRFEKVGSMMESSKPSRYYLDPSRIVTSNRIPVIMWKHRAEDRYGVEIGEQTSLWSSNMQIVISGTQGVISINNWMGGHDALTLHKEGRTIDIHLLGQNYLSRPQNAEDEHPSFWPSVPRMTENFIDSILEDREPRLNVEDGREILKFALSVGKASKENRTITVDSIT